MARGAWDRGSTAPACCVSGVPSHRSGRPTPIRSISDDGRRDRSRQSIDRSIDPARWCHSPTDRSIDPLGGIGRPSYRRADRFDGDGAGRMPLIRGWDVYPSGQRRQEQGRGDPLCDGADRLLVGIHSTAGPAVTWRRAVAVALFPGRISRMFAASAVARSKAFIHPH